MNTVEREKWAVRRAKGMAQYVIIDGGLKFGVVIFVAYYAFRLLLARNSVTGEDLAYGAVICFAAGLIFGIVTWLINEMRFD